MISKRDYTHLSRLSSFEDRYEYLRLDGVLGKATFGPVRYLNQRFYKSREWKQVREHVIVRDSACDLGIHDREILDKVLVHHMNPVTVEDLEEFNPEILDPEFLITISMDTHNAVHYGDGSLLIPSKPLERKPGDTVLWR